MMRVNSDNSLYFIKWFFFETMAVCPGVLTWRQMASLAGFGYRGEATRYLGEATACCRLLDSLSAINEGGQIGLMVSSVEDRVGVYRGCEYRHDSMILIWLIVEVIDREHFWG